MSAFTDGVSRVRGPQAFQKVVSDFNKLAQKDGTADTGALNQYRNYLRDILGYGLDDNLGKGTIPNSTLQRNSCNKLPNKSKKLST